MITERRGGPWGVWNESSDIGRSGDDDGYVIMGVGYRSNVLLKNNCPAAFCPGALNNTEGG